MADVFPLLHREHKPYSFVIDVIFDRKPPRMSSDEVLHMGEFNTHGIPQSSQDYVIQKKHI